MATTDRKILIVGGLLMVLVSTIAFVLSPPPQDPGLVPTTYSSGSGGARAAYVLLGELGHDVERWQRPPADLTEGSRGDLLILAEPTFPLSLGDREALRRFLEEGGAILAAGPAAVDLVESWSGNLGVVTTGERETYRAVFPSPLARGAPEIVMGSSGDWTGERPPSIVIYGKDEAPSVLTTTLGGGRLIWWADATPLTNAGLKEDGSLELLLNAVGPPGERRILWDEYFHGHRSSLGSYLSGTPVPWGFVQAGLVFLVILLARARRWGPVFPPPVASRLAPQEFTEMVGGLYQEARSSWGAVGIVYHRFRSLLARQLGLPRAMTTEEIARRLAGRLGRDEGFGRTLRECETAGPGLEEMRALQLIQAMHRYSRRLGIIRASMRGTP